MRRTPTFAVFLLFLALGTVAGLSWAWLVAPRQPAGSSPAQLNIQDREIYLRLVADSYAADGDPSLAAQRLAALGPDGRSQLAALVAGDLGDARASGEVTRLATLAVALGIDSPAVALLAPPRPLPPATADPTAAIEATPTSQPTDGQPRFRLVDRGPLCNPGEPAGRIEILVVDTVGEPLPGLVVSVTWNEGQDAFYTGFDAARGPGYADFDMEPDIVYAVAIADDEPSAVDLQIHACPDGKAGGWRLEYQE